jgi:hypothetical protein
MNSVLAHIAGASGSGKTTLAELITKERPDLEVKDLDEFDDEAVSQLGWTKIKKNDYTDEMLKKLADLRQKLMDEHMKSVKKPIVYVGHHWEGDHKLSIPARNKYRIDVDAETSAKRAYLRSQKEKPEHRRKLEELPEDIEEAKQVIASLDKEGYKPLSQDKILSLFGVESRPKT